MKYLLAALAMPLSLLPFGQSALAQADYPSKPITIVVPYPPGGQGDVFARLIAERLSTRLKQTVVVENKAGATGAIGTRIVTKAASDGYTLLLGQTGEIAVNQFVVKSLGYDPVKDLKPIVLIGDGPLILAVPGNSPYNSVQELVLAARTKPGAVSYASSGTATPGHLAAAALALGTKTQMAHVPYKGGGQALTDLMGGHVQFFFSSASAAMAHIASGKIKALAISSPQRQSALPQIPTVAETVVPAFSYSLWGGLFAPAGTSDDIVALLNREVNTVLTEPLFKNRLEGDGNTVRNNSAAQFTDFVARDISKYSLVIKAIGIQAE
jgi:tripartite-type tricarboxylate transporter receptor subunit TctC